MEKTEESARNLLKAGRLDEALQLFTDLSESDPKHYFNKALVLFKLDRHEEALLDIDSGLAELPGDEKALQLKELIESKIHEEMNAKEVVLSPLEDEVISCTPREGETPVNFKDTHELDQYKRSIQEFIGLYLNKKWDEELGEKQYPYDDIIVYEPSSQAGPPREGTPARPPAGPVDTLIKEIERLAGNEDVLHDGADVLDTMMARVNEYSSALDTFTFMLFSRLFQILDGASEDMAGNGLIDEEKFMDALLHCKIQLGEKVDEWRGNIARVMDVLEKIKPERVLQDGTGESPGSLEAMAVEEEMTVEPGPGGIENDPHADGHAVRQMTSLGNKQITPLHAILSLEQFPNDVNSITTHVKHLQEFFPFPGAGPFEFLFAVLESNGETSAPPMASSASGLDGKLLVARLTHYQDMVALGRGGERATGRASHRVINEIDDELESVFETDYFYSLGSRAPPQSVAECDDEDDDPVVLSDSDGDEREDAGAGSTAISPSPHALASKTRILMAAESMDRIIGEIKAIPETYDEKCGTDKGTYIEQQASKHLSMGRTLYENAEYEDAMRIYEALHAILPEKAEILFFLSFCSREIGLYSKAASYLKQIIDIWYDNAYAWYNLSMIFAMINDGPRELFSLRKAKQFGYLVDINRLSRLAVTFHEKNPFEDRL